MNDFLSLPARTAFAIGGYPPLICSAEGAGGPESGAATRCRRGGRATLISFLHPLKGSSRKINIWGWGTWYNVLRHNGKWYNGIRHKVGNGNQA